MKSTHLHPNPLLDRITQYGAIAVIVVMLVAALLQIVLAFLGVRLGALFLPMALFVVLLTPFMLMLTTATPGITISPEGIEIQPLIWKRQFVPWSEVRAFKPYPLLPQHDSEIGRKALAGRKRYQPAQGKMLVVPRLPVQYRIVGFLAGEGWTPVIAVTNRTHQEYEKLVKKISVYTEYPEA
jgi:hypothetical protein